jgi:hypothetical protein
MKLAREALAAVLVATWIIGLVHQLGSWPMTATYVAISFAMVAMIFGDRLASNSRPGQSADGNASASHSKLALKQTTEIGVLNA